MSYVSEMCGKQKKRKAGKEEKAGCDFRALFQTKLQLPTGDPAGPGSWGGDKGRGNIIYYNVVSR